MTKIDWKRFRAAGLIVLAALTTLLTGCTRFTDTVSLPSGHQEYALYGSRTIGQTFVCYHAGLNGIGVLLKAGAGDLVLHLREDAESASDIATVTLSPPPGDTAVYHQFDVPLQDDVNGETFFLLLEAPDATAEAPFVVYYDPNLSSQYDLSLDGGDLTPGHLSFQLHYSSLHIAKDLVRQTFSFGLEALWLLFLSALFYLLPGGAVVVWLLREGDWIERAIVALGMSVAVYALLMYATMTGLCLGPAATIGFLVLCAVLIGVRWWLDWRRDRPRIPGVRDMWASIKRDPSPVALVFVFALVLGVRIFVVRDLVAPRWGDSYHHTVIAQLLVDHGGIFESWEPYAPYAGLTTHFGFHANVAAFHWLSGIGAIRSVIWVGQVLNVLACLALYPLGNRIGGRWAGVWAVLAGGLLAATPMAYVNWGRYPQLTGQALLPIGAWLLWQFLDEPDWNWRLILLNAVVALGQFLGYYRMPYYFVILAGALILSLCLPKFRLRWRLWGGLLFRLLAIGVLCVVLILPWGLHLVQGRLTTLATAAVSQVDSVDYVRSGFRQWTGLTAYVSMPLLVAASVALLWSLARGAWTAFAIGCWGIGLFLVVASPLIGFPGAFYLNAFSSMIFVYAPVSLMVGWLGETLAALSSRHWGQRSNLVHMGVIVLFVLLGAFQSVQVSDPSYELVKPADLEAMAWIRDHTPRDARFLVNGFLIYNGTTIVGSDAGWWIPLLAERENTMPPQYALTVEREVTPGYGLRLIELVAGLRDAPLSTPTGLWLVCDSGVTHVYVGQEAGRVGKPSPDPLFTAYEMLSNPAFEALYHQGGVWVFAVTEAACGS